MSENYFVIGAKEVYVHLELLEAELSKLRNQKNRKRDLETLDGNSENCVTKEDPDDACGSARGASSPETSSQLTSSDVPRNRVLSYKWKVQRSVSKQRNQFQIAMVSIQARRFCVIH